MRPIPVIDGKPMKPGPIDPGFDASEYTACLKDCYVEISKSSMGRWRHMVVRSARGSGTRRGSYETCEQAVEGLKKKLRKERAQWSRSSSIRS